MSELKTIKGIDNVVDFVKSVWSEKPLPNTAHALFGSEEGIRKQLDALYDNRGEVLFFENKNDKLVVSKVIADLTFVKPDDFEIMGYNINEELYSNK